MFSLSYVSSANRTYSREELGCLASVCVANNARDDVTGVLLYKGGNFMQLLEGPEAAVRRLYSIIGCDTRHRGLITLLQGAIEKRHFPGWAMRLEVLADGTASSGERKKFLEDIVASAPHAARPDPAATLLLRFAGSGP
jgi:hypothetical protein